MLTPKIRHILPSYAIWQFDDFFYGMMYADLPFRREAFGVVICPVDTTRSVIEWNWIPRESIVFSYKLRQINADPVNYSHRL